MIFHVKDTIALLNESKEAEKQIYKWIDGKISPATSIRDDALEVVLRSGFNLRQQALAIMREFEPRLKEKLFEISEDADKLLMSLYERRGHEFTDRAAKFFESSLAESVNRFSEWLSIQRTTETINRRFTEWRRRGGSSYRRAERSQYTRRSSGEYKRKIVIDKSKFLQRQAERALAREFERALEQALKEKQELIDATPFFKPQTAAPFAIANKTRQQLERGRSRHILITQDKQAIDLYTEEAPYE